MHCEPSFEDGNIGWNTLDHLGIPLAQSGEFHLDCILRCAHQFDFSPHVQDLTMTLMTQRGLRDLQCLEAWGIRVAQQEAIGSGFPIVWLHQIGYLSFGVEWIQQLVSVVQELFGADWDIIQVFTWDPVGGAYNDTTDNSLFKHSIVTTNPDFSLNEFASKFEQTSERNRQIMKTLKSDTVAECQGSTNRIFPTYDPNNKMMNFMARDNNPLENLINHNNVQVTSL